MCRGRSGSSVAKRVGSPSTSTRQWCAPHPTGRCSTASALGSQWRRTTSRTSSSVTSGAAPARPILTPRAAGEGDGEARPAFGGGPRGDVATHPAYESRGDREPETLATRRTAAAVALVQHAGLEGDREVLRRQARSGVAHLDPTGARREHDRAAAGGDPSALSSSPSRTCRSRAGSARTTAGVGSAVTETPAADARACQAEAVVVTSAATSTSATAIRKSSACSRARASRSPTYPSSRSASPTRIAPTSRASSGGTVPSASPSAYPRTAVSGVRSSWETESRNRRWRSSLVVSAASSWPSALRHVGHLGGTGGGQRDASLAGGQSSSGAGGLGEGRSQPAGQPGGEREGDERPEAEREHHPTAYGRERGVGAADVRGQHHRAAATRGAGLDEHGYAVELGAGRDGLPGPQPGELVRGQGRRGSGGPGRGDDADGQPGHLGRAVEPVGGQGESRQPGQQVGLPGEGPPDRLLASPGEQRRDEHAGQQRRHRGDSGHGEGQPGGEAGAPHARLRAR